METIKPPSLPHLALLLAATALLLLACPFRAIEISVGWVKTGVIIIARIIDPTEDP